MLLLNFNIFILLTLVNSGEIPVFHSPAQPIMQTHVTQKASISTEKSQLTPTAPITVKPYVDNKLIFPTDKPESSPPPAASLLSPDNNRSKEVNCLIFKTFISKFEFRKYDISDFDTRFI